MNQRIINKLIFLMLGIILITTIAFYKYMDKKEESIAPDLLVDREVFFGNPDRAMVNISPDGKYVAYLAPFEDVMNVWVADINNIENAKVITNSKNKGIKGYVWSYDSAHILYMKDENGDENWRLYSIDVKKLKKKLLTPSSGIRSDIVKLSKKNTHEALITLNQRSREIFDVYKVNLLTGKLELVYENNKSFFSFFADDDLNLRAAYKLLPNGTGEIHHFKNSAKNETEIAYVIDYEDMQSSHPRHISDDGRYLYINDSKEINTAALKKLDLKTKEITLIYENELVDIEGIFYSRKDDKVLAINVEYDRPSWVFLNAELEEDFKFLNSHNPNFIRNISMSLDQNYWIVLFNRDNGPGEYYYYDRRAKKLSFLFVNNQDLLEHKFAMMHPKIIKARDSMELTAYLTVPRWLDDGNGNPKYPTPFVLLVHGGPNARDYWGFNSVHQWLANRGYSVLSINYRGSSGFGKFYLNSGNGQWSRAMQDDLEDAAMWAVKNNIAIEDKMAIMGGSYGGYATLVAMTKTPKLFAAGIDIVGPSNLITLVETTPPYWKPFMASLIKKLGASTATERGKEFLRRASPLSYAEKVENPLMIVHGKNDQRVKQDESDQFVNKLKENNIPVHYIIYTDEGHGLSKAINRLSMYDQAERFLSIYVGGRFHKASQSDYSASSMKVIEKGFNLELHD